ncbi:microtubule-associated protein 6 homolog [Scleropages formosus]|uniref:Microtubule-associated protein 6b n=1 Tax=Scleropages formosus TaxID=113540 RepID=A0A8D0CMX1_SCLFO|nr:microtubule-associated protein 6 homolog [Scleropages formosus]
MAWPCITRACCINRFWTELDKADIAVPLVFTKYSDATDEPHFHVQPRSKQAPPQGRVAIETQPTQGVSRAAGAEGSTASVMRQDFRAWKVRPERSCKPKNEYQPSEIPFNNETQYQKDFKPWPIPKKRDHPWIPKPSLSARSWRAPPAEDESGLEKSETADKVQEKEMKQQARKQEKKERAAERLSGRADAAVEGRGRAAVDALNRQIKEELGTGSSYRNEFKAYMDVKPVKPIRARSQYNPPVEEKSSLETSYSATFRGEQSRHLSADNKLQEHRRIRSLYSEPGRELSKVEKPSTPKSKPKKTSTPVSSHSKPVKKAKEKQVSSVAGNKKKASEKDPESTPAEGEKKKAKEINNKLAEAKE